MRYGTRHHRRALSAPALLLLVLLGAGSLAGCGAPLEVDDPTTILEEEVNTAEGAELLRRDALATLFDAADQAVFRGGLLADEFRYQPVLSSEISAEVVIARRASEDEQQPYGHASHPYTTWQALRSRVAPLALTKLRAYARPGAREAHVGEMFALRGYAALRLAEDFCPGFPLHEVENYKLVLGAPASTQQVLEQALAAFDSARTWAADSVRVLHFARLGRARTLLQLGRFAEAAAAAADVPTAFRYQTEYSATITPPTPFTNQLTSELGWPGASHPWGVVSSVADREGGRGLDFVSAQDPRVVTIPRNTARDGSMLYAIGKYPSRTTPIVLASGVEARLIQAEAALRANDPQWLPILNTLRTDGDTLPNGSYKAGTGGVAGLAPLTDPGSEAARVDLVFRERAFWLFATGTRLGDLRRLMRLYGRPSESVFPTGPYWLGGTYGPATSLLFHQSEQQFGAERCTGA